MKKLSKRCYIKLFVQNTGIVTETHNYGKQYMEFSGTKNDVMSKLRKYLLTYNGFTGRILADTLNAINKTSIVYNSLGEGAYETTVHSFNPIANSLFTFKVKYIVERLSNMPGRYRTNHRGENLYEKRLIQLHGGGRFGRYRLAVENVNIDRLLELLSPMISTQFQNGTSIEFSKGNRIDINFPRRFEFKPNEDLSVTVCIGECCGYYSASVDIFYKGCRVNLLGKYPDIITEEKINEALNIAKKFDEICEIIKKAYNL